MTGTERVTIAGRDVVIRPCEPGDAPAIERLYALAFGASVHEALRDREWRYERNPAGPHRSVVAVLDDGEVIASYTAIPLRARLLGREVRVAAVQDAMTHPAFRGAVLGRNGLFVRTVHAWIRAFTGPLGVQFAFGTPQRRHARLGRMLMGYEIWDEIGYYSREIEDTLIKRARRRLPSSRVEPFDTFGPAADRLWERLGPAYPSAVERDARYLRWRYDDAPGRSYERLALRGAGGEWRAWIVLSLAGDTATIVDALLPPDTPGSASPLMYRGIGVALRRGARFIQAFARPGSPMEALLLANGFWPSEFQGSRFATRVFDPAFPSDAVRASWFFQPGDTDEV